MNPTRMLSGCLLYAAPLLGLACDPEGGGATPAVEARQCDDAELGSCDDFVCSQETGICQCLGADGTEACRVVVDCAEGMTPIPLSLGWSQDFSAPVAGTSIHVEGVLAGQTSTLFDAIAVVELHHAGRVQKFEYPLPSSSVWDGVGFAADVPIEAFSEPSEASSVIKAYVYVSEPGGGDAYRVYAAPLFAHRQGGQLWVYDQTQWATTFDGGDYLGVHDNSSPTGPVPVFQLASGTPDDNVRSSGICVSWRGDYADDDAGTDSELGPDYPAFGAYYTVLVSGVAVSSGRLDQMRGCVLAEDLPSPPFTLRVWNDVELSFQGRVWRTRAFVKLIEQDGAWQQAGRWTSAGAPVPGTTSVGDPATDGDLIADIVVATGSDLSSAIEHVIPLVDARTKALSAFVTAFQRWELELLAAGQNPPRPGIGQTLTQEIWIGDVLGTSAFGTAGAWSTFGFEALERRFLVAHEAGHVWVGSHSSVGAGADYSINDPLCPSSSGPTGFISGSHALFSAELRAPALGEAWAHFMAALAFNRSWTQAMEGDLGADYDNALFKYYKQGSAGGTPEFFYDYDEVDLGLFPSGATSDPRFGASYFRDNCSCPSGSCDDRKTEGDALRLLWALFNQPGREISLGDMLVIYEQSLLRANDPAPAMWAGLAADQRPSRQRAFSALSCALAWEEASCAP